MDVLTRRSAIFGRMGPPITSRSTGALLARMFSRGVGSSPAVATLASLPAGFERLMLATGSKTNPTKYRERIRRRHDTGVTSVLVSCGRNHHDLGGGGWCAVTTLDAPGMIRLTTMQNDSSSNNSNEQQASSSNSAQDQNCCCLHSATTVPHWHRMLLFHDNNIVIISADGVVLNGMLFLETIHDVPIRLLKKWNVF